MKVLVTGGAGKVGRRILPTLAREFDVVVFDLVPPDAPVPYIRGDILDSAALHYAMRDCDAVIHLAAIPAPGGVSDDTLMQINVLGTQRVVEAAALGRPRRLVMASSESTYGMTFSGGAIPPLYLPIDENHPTRPRDAYGLSKLVGEEICRRYTRAYGLETICLRYPWVFWEEHYAGLKDWQQRPGDFRGTMWSYIDVRDLARAFVAALKVEEIQHETVLVAARNNYAGRPTLDLVREFYGPEVLVRDPDYFARCPQASPLICEKAARILGWHPEHDWRAETAHTV
ncbi:MAG: NAD(P)-dependent oxidoreductase [Armatimonadetes bacterium]|nr:NAD(P)-dependent oxidoreductase [Armatimonadota bacterium]